MSAPARDREPLLVEVTGERDQAAYDAAMHGAAWVLAGARRLSERPGAA
jgi:hypothetical protein